MFNETIVALCFIKKSDDPLKLAKIENATRKF